ncbi:hypothetical protein E4T49_00056 [Aureobasidium sp. EXF-10728]|nr:hypothetical protein E4T49_00056 [Aureobasidium sp. EXF-10728]
MADTMDAKPARYRSQRKPAVASTPQTTQDAGIGRSRSRYHKTRPAAAHTQEHSPVPEPTHDAPILPTRSRSTRDSRGRDASRDAEAGAFDSGDDGYGSMRSQPKSLEQSKPPPREDIMAIARAQAPTQIRAKVENYIPDQEEGEVSAEETAGCFGMFGRKKKKTKTAATPLNARPAVTKPDEPPVIRPGGRGIVPMTDAPLSALNGAPEGSRRVRVECNGKFIDLPVEPTTSAADLIASAANCLSEPIDLKSSVLLESFTSKVDVTRPLRRYEYVFDVMNSWDEDRSNSLQIVPARVLSSNSSNLSLANVPRERPRETSFLVQHSQKPGTWHKRLVTIRQDGQLVAAKPNKESETTNIGHLTDFDIYTPTARFMSKMLKPPKKICYAVKSQQKSNIFQQDSKSVYVHFFCTSDETLATNFHDAVQGWRSWYLHHAKDEGKKKTATGLGRSSSKATKQSKQSSHAHQPSTGSMDAHYQLGSYKPLMDLDKFDRPSSSKGQDTTSGAPARKPSVRERSSHPSAMSQQQKLADDEPLGKLAGNRRPSFDQDSAAEREAFAGDGLLGRSYSTRQRVAAEREAAAKNPWASGPSLLSGNQAETLTRQGSVKRTESTRRADGHATDLRHRPSTRERLMAADDGLKRSGSTRAKEMSKPLVDLTPTYKPPPQHLKKGRGIRPDEIGPGGLIDNATSPEQAYQIPSAHDWRGGHVTAAANAGVSRQRSLAHRPAPDSTDDAFTGRGLLNNARGGYDGKNSIGRGVMSGNRNAREPMLDVSEEGRYAPGSLLNQVARTEREEGRGGPIIDRSK